MQIEGLCNMSCFFSSTRAGTNHIQLLEKHVFERNISYDSQTLRVELRKFRLNVDRLTE